ncbi:hypothetical protein [endosymbiont GvMRE of Glomus versiforme]|uniref:hypothetical protein n=1 Tax=endosymbiont GvMRE of Glomus versiforme TaxID=2039283 RepID=UPI000EEBB79A|nr:hypothetical protein [endosymbiont GvMRE of Glomus versiforme]RHZ35549.1 hypothetical protein GvMRE_IIg8 [endosymbiont GvMRE of Glomus versiforme]
MAKEILENQIEETPSQKGKYKNRILNVHRDEIFYREDIKYTFAYAIIGVSVLAILTSIGYLGIQQLRK